MFKEIQVEDSTTFGKSHKRKKPKTVSVFQKTPQDKIFRTEIEKNIYMNFNRADRRKKRFEVNEDGGVKVTDSVSTVPVQNQYKAYDFHNHFVVAKKGHLSNDYYWYKRIIKQLENQKKYKKGLFK